MDNVQLWYSGPVSSDAAAIERSKQGCRDGTKRVEIFAPSKQRKENDDE